MLRARPSRANSSRTFHVETKPRPYGGGKGEGRRKRPVNEEQINVIGFEGTQRLVERSARIIGQVKAVVELAGNKDIGSVQLGVADALADSLLVSVHLRRVDVPVTNLQGGLHRFRGSGRLDLEDTEPKLRDVLAVVNCDDWNAAHG